MVLFNKIKCNKLLVFFLLYLAQSIPMSFFSTILQVMMRQSNFNLASIAMVQMIKLPWIVKFLWSPAIDKNCLTKNDFKRYIFISEIFYAILIMIISLFNFNDHIYVIIFVLFFSFIASATQDIATDALASLSFSKNEKSILNSIQSMGSFGGTLLGSGLLLLVFHKYGWHTITPLLALFAFVAIIPLFFEKSINILDKSQSSKASYKDIVLFFARKDIWKQIGFLFLYYSSIIGILSVLRSYMVDLGYTIKEIGFYSGVLGTFVAFVCSFISGLVIKKIGRYKSRILFSFVILITTLFFLLMTYTSINTVFLVFGICLLWGTYGISTVLVYTTSMDCVRSGREGTDFTIQTVITHISSMIVALHCGRVADVFGYRGLFGLEVVLAIFSLLYVLCFFKRKNIE